MRETVRGAEFSITFLEKCSSIATHFKNAHHSPRQRQELNVFDLWNPPPPGTICLRVSVLLQEPGGVPPAQQDSPPPAPAPASSKDLWSRVEVPRSPGCLLAPSAPGLQDLLSYGSLFLQVVFPAPFASSLHRMSLPYCIWMVSVCPFCHQIPLSYRCQCLCGCQGG